MSISSSQNKCYVIFFNFADMENKVDKIVLEDRAVWFSWIHLTWSGFSALYLTTAFLCDFISYK